MIKVRFQGRWSLTPWTWVWTRPRLPWLPKSWSSCCWMLFPWAATFQRPRSQTTTTSQETWCWPHWGWSWGTVWCWTTWRSAVLVWPFASAKTTYFSLSSECLQEDWSRIKAVAKKEKCQKQTHLWFCEYNINYTCINQWYQHREVTLPWDFVCCHFWLLKKKDVVQTYYQLESSVNTVLN